MQPQFGLTHIWLVLRFGFSFGLCFSLRTIIFGELLALITNVRDGLFLCWSKIHVFMRSCRWTYVLHVQLKMRTIQWSMKFPWKQHDVLYLYLGRKRNLNWLITFEVICSYSSSVVSPFNVITTAILLRDGIKWLRHSRYLFECKVLKCFSSFSYQVSI